MKIINNVCHNCILMIYKHKKLMVKKKLNIKKLFLFLYKSTRLRNLPFFLYKIENPRQYYIVYCYIQVLLLSNSLKFIVHIFHLKLFLSLILDHLNIFQVLKAEIDLIIFFYLNFCTAELFHIIFF